MNADSVVWRTDSTADMRVTAFCVSKSTASFAVSLSA